MPRGGARGGKPNTAYQNRTDLNQPHALPVTAATGQPYGQAGAQRAAQAVVPMGNAPLGIGNNPSPQGQPQGQPSQPPPFTGPTPGSVPSPFAPTNNPDEHFMTGVNAGPGQGSEALAPNPFANNQAAAILATLNSIPNPSPQVQFYKNYMQAQADNQAPASVLGH